MTSGSNISHLQELRMFHQGVVEYEIVTESPEEQVDDHRPQIGDHKEADQLADGILLAPPCRVHVRAEEVIIRYVQDEIHDGT